MCAILRTVRQFWIAIAVCSFLAGSCILPAVWRHSGRASDEFILLGATLMGLGVASAVGEIERRHHLRRLWPRMSYRTHWRSSAAYAPVAPLSIVVNVELETLSVRQPT